MLIRLTEAVMVEGTWQEAGYEFDCPPSTAQSYIKAGTAEPAQGLHAVGECPPPDPNVYHRIGECPPPDPLVWHQVGQCPPPDPLVYHEAATCPNLPAGDAARGRRADKGPGKKRD